MSALVEILSGLGDKGPAAIVVEAQPGQRVAQARAGHLDLALGAQAARQRRPARQPGPELRQGEATVVKLDGDRVRMAGRAVTVLRGELLA